jgi:hypothetical protein
MHVKDHATMIRKLGSLAVAATLGAALTGGVIAATAATSNTSTVYYACLSSGTLSNVGTAAPKCTAPAKQISWNQTGPQGPAGNSILSGTGAPASTLGTAGYFYIETSNHTLYGPATHTCNPLPCHTIWGAGTPLVGPAGVGGAAYQTSGAATVGDSGQVLLADLKLPDGYFTLDASVGTLQSTLGNGNLGLYCQLDVNYNNGFHGTLDEANVPTLGQVPLTGSVYYNPGVGGTGYALVWCSPEVSEPTGNSAAVTAHLTATHVATLTNQ